MSNEIVPGEFDIILGRSKDAFNHKGNGRYRFIIDQHGKRYQACSSKEAKTRMTDSIIRSIQDSGGRFLQKNMTTGMYEEVDDVHEKVSHALRSSNKPKKKPSSSSAKSRKPRRKSPITTQDNQAFELLHEDQLIAKQT